MSQRSDIVREVAVGMCNSSVVVESDAKRDSIMQQLFK